jgi:protein-L-isoaspartate O-methyltransferase
LAQQIALEQLDAVLDRADALMRSDYAAAMRMLNDISVDIPQPAAANDPFGSDYADWVMSTYRRIAAIDAYEPSTHEADRNVVTDMPLPQYFPFSTGDLGFIGRYMTGVGMILAELDLPRGSHVVEYGTGWGHVAAALARAGHRVTCVDIEAKFLRLAQRQAESLGCTVAAHHGAFGDPPFAPDAPRADAVVFFEAFHHAFEHLNVLRRLRHEVLRPGGILVLAAEPVSPAFPLPWGLRPDGHALWAVRRHKWMELGFQEDYLLRALLREGFLVSRTRLEALGSFGLLYRCRLHDGCVRLAETLLPGAEAASWAPAPPRGEPWLWAQVDSRATLDCDPRWTAVAVMIANPLPVPLEAALDAGGPGPAIRRRFAPGEQMELRMPLPRSDRELRVWSETAVPAQLGINDDRRPLGIAVKEMRYHAE